MFTILSREENPGLMRGHMMAVPIMVWSDNGTMVPIQVEMTLSIQPMLGGVNLSGLTLERVIQQLPAPLVASAQMLSPVSMQPQQQHEAHFAPYGQFYQQQHPQSPIVPNNSPVLHGFHNVTPPGGDAIGMMSPVDGAFVTPTPHFPDSPDLQQMQEFANTLNELTQQQQSPQDQTQDEEEEEDDEDDDQSPDEQVFTYDTVNVTSYVVCHACGEAGHVKKDCAGYKRTLCTYFPSPTGCNRGYKCRYAHGEHELRPMPSDGEFQRCVFVTRLPGGYGANTTWEVRGCLGPHEHKLCPERNCPPCGSSGDHWKRDCPERRRSCKICRTRDHWTEDCSSYDPSRHLIN